METYAITGSRGVPRAARARADRMICRQRTWEGRPIVTAARRFACDDSGLETVEYAVIAGIVVSGLVVIILAIGNWVARRFINMQQGLPGA